MTLWCRRPFLPNLPHEIWLHIAQFIPATVLEGLLGLNSTFYNIAMDCRYRQMSFVFLHYRMLRNIIRLQDPAVAKRVRILHVYPVFLKQMLDGGHELDLGTKPLRLRLASLAHQLLDHKRPTGSKKLRANHKFKTADQVVHALLDVFASLPNVTDYHIMWCGLHPVPESPVPFLAAVFASSLRKLSLDISLENVDQLLAPMCTPHTIEELDLVIRVDHFAHVSDHSEIMMRHLAPAVNRLKNSLRKLAIQAWEPLDLSLLFHSIETLPYLEHFTIGIPVEAPHLGNPFDLATFLNRQSRSLRSLSLRATQYSGPGLNVNPDLITKWVIHATSAVHLKSLRSLEICSSLFPLAASLVCLHQFSSTIISLVVTGCYHTSSDIAAIMAAFRTRPRSERLETLRLGSVALTPELLDLLSQELPNLNRLELLVREVMAHSDEYLLSYKPASECQIDYFFSEMEKRRYPQWHLRRLKILLTSFPYRFSYGQLIEQLLATSLNTIIH